MIRADVTHVFDMDGVLLDTNAAKSQAFAAMASAYGEEAARWMVDFHQRAGSISRRDRVEALFREHLEREPRPGEVECCLELIADELAGAYARARRLPGVTEYLRRLDGARTAVVSGVEQHELESILEVHGLRFRLIAGGNKHALLPHLVESGAIELPAVYYGDTRDDLEAATAAGLDFVLVYGCSEWRDWSAALPPEVRAIRDFRELLAPVAVRVDRDGYGLVGGERRYLGRSLAGALVRVQP